MSGHGWVTPNQNGMRARCGGPGICRECQREQALKGGAVMETDERLEQRIANLEDALRPFAKAWDQAGRQVPGSTSLGVLASIACYFVSGADYQRAFRAMQKPISSAELLQNMNSSAGAIDDKGGGRGA